MTPRSWTCLLAALLACTDDDRPRTRDLDAALSADLDADSTPPARDAGPVSDGAPPTFASASLAVCATDPLPLLSDCRAPDPGQPSSAHAPALLHVEPGCGWVQGWAADRSEDVYRFTLAKSDPVQLLLHYRGAAPAALALSLVDDHARALTRSAPSGNALDQTEVLTWQTSTGTSYDVSVSPSRVGTCLPYTLRVDPQWCTDALEDNDDAARPSQLGGASVLHVAGTLSAGDDDFFQFTAAKTDPIQMRGTYSVPDGDTLQITRSLATNTGLAYVLAQGARSGASETFSHWLVPNRSGAQVSSNLSGVGTGCASYTLDFDLAACTDALEDNDDRTQPSPLAVGATVSASVFRADDDYFALSAFPHGGSCVLQFTLGAKSTAPPTLVVASASGGTLASAARGTAESTRALSWSGAADVLVVSTASIDDCQSYTLRCEATPSP